MIEAWKEKGRLHICFRDDGTGMPSEALENFFEPYYKSPLDKAEGEMDMDTVYSVVTLRLGGKIDCHNEKGIGMVFSIEIPTGEKEEQEHVS